MHSETSLRAKSAFGRVSFETSSFRNVLRRQTASCRTLSAAMTRMRHISVIGVLLGIWMGAICLGILLQGESSESKPVQTKFDKAFRAVGGLFVAIAWFVRVAAMKTGDILRASKPSRLAGSSLVLAPGALYSAHAALRLFLYKAHTYLINTSAMAGHVMSDHVLLSSCILSGLLCELYLALQEGGRGQGNTRRSRDNRTRGLLGDIIGVHTLLHVYELTLIIAIVGLAAHAHITARYFHHWSETLTSVGLGGIAFKWTGWRFLMRNNG
jgi:hypothetical protein